MFDPKKFKSINMDAVGDLFFANQLNVIQQRVYEYQYPQFRAFEFIPVNYSDPDGAQFISTTQYQSVGRARIINSYADDLPEASVIGMMLTSPVKSIGTSYRYSHDEIRAARFVGMDLPFHLAEAARRANDELVNNLAIVGDPETGLTGLLNNPAVPVVAIPDDGIGVSTEWTTKTPEQVLRDMNLVVNSIVANSNGVELPNTLLLPIEQYTYISSTPRSTASDTTIREYFLMNNPFISVVSWMPQLSGAGVGGTDMMIAFERNSNKLEMRIPLAFTQYAPQERNLEFVIPCQSKFGGVSIYYPLSVAVGEGI